MIAKAIIPFFALTLKIIFKVYCVILKHNWY